MTSAEFLLPHFDHEAASTRRILECVPEDKLSFKPHSKSMSLGQLAGHVADLPAFLSVMIETDELELSTAEFKPFLPKTRAELLEHFDQQAAAARALLAKTDEKKMAETWRLTFKGGTVMHGIRREVLLTTIAHQVHHRGQLTVYLRLNDVKFPGVYGPSADEMAAFA